MATEFIRAIPTIDFEPALIQYLKGVHTLDEDIQYCVFIGRSVGFVPCRTWMVLFRHVVYFTGMRYLSFDDVIRYQAKVERTIGSLSVAFGPSFLTKMQSARDYAASERFEMPLLEAWDLLIERIKARG